jgi:hypothetical protein
VKPDNLMLTSDGTVKVLDFGLAALTAERGAGGLTEANVLMGTPEYMAPEQAKDPRKADTRADIYSLGCTLYHLLAGGVPYPADTSLMKVLAHHERPVPSVRALRPEVPKDLDAVLVRLLAKRPEDRYQTPGEVAAALAPFAQPAVSPTKPRRWVVAVAALLLAGITVAGAVVYRIQTDKGELVITTESDDVEVVVKKGGKLIRIIDAKTAKSIILDSGTYDLELKGAPKGLKLDIDKATLTRGDKVLAKIERTVKPVAARPEPAPEIRYYLLGSPARQEIAMGDFSPDGRLLLVSGNGGRARLFDFRTGKAIRDLETHSVTLFTPDGKWIVAQM